MSPPAIHAQYDLARTGDALPADALKSFKTGPGGEYLECVVNNYSGPQFWGEAAKAKKGGCPFGFTAPAPEEAAAQEPPLAASGDVQLPWPFPIHECALLNTDLDVRLAYTVPYLPCEPCALNFTFSMNVEPGYYTAVGFKEMNAAYLGSNIMPTEIENYWGMATAMNYSTPLSGRILGASHNLCLRHLSAQAAYVGVVEDVEDDGFFKNLIVESNDGRVSISFTAPPLSLGKTFSDVAWSGSALGVQRIMWATGPINGDDDCSQDNVYGYHSSARAVVALAFPGPVNVDCPE